MQSSAHLLHVLQPYGLLGYLFAFGISLAEALAFVGFFVPGMTLIVLMGGLASHGFYSFWLLVLVATLGAAAGDAMSYEFGRVSKRFLHHRPRLWKHIQKTEPIFRSYGWMSVGIGRFTSPVRGILPLVAGIGGMQRIPFYIANVFFAVVWALGSITAGYLLGNASRVAIHSSHKAAFIFFLIAFVAFGMALWLWRKRRKLAMG